MFELLWKTKHSQDDDWAEASTWQPFKGMDTGRILKATTLDIAGVEVNNKSLRIAAESYADQVGSAGVQDSLNFVEGHTKRVANEYYRRNGSAAKMAPWGTHIEGLINSKDSPDEIDGVDTTLDERIEKTMDVSQQEWKKRIAQKIQDLIAKDRLKSQPWKAFTWWSVEEDAELRRLVRIYGESSWKDIYENSVILQKRYETSRSGKKLLYICYALFQLLVRSIILTLISFHSLSRPCIFERPMEKVITPSET